MMHRNQSVNVHQFAMVPRADIPRASFNIQTSHKTTFNAGDLVPIVCEEILPGDTFRLNMTAFARLATPLNPIMDNLYLDSFFFFVPNRLVWENWVRFMGEQPQINDSISYIVPTITSPVGGFAALSIYDYMGIPTVGQVAGAGTITINALPLRAYNLIFNEWFRDENLVVATAVQMGDGPDLDTLYTLKKRGKRHDYFTACLPWPQKGASVSMPLGTTAPVIANPSQPIPAFKGVTSGTVGMTLTRAAANPGAVSATQAGTAGEALQWNTTANTTGLIADLSTATAATINQLRQSFQIQKLLERDARGGTRYTEIIRAHFGVISPDARLQRPEYLGGGSTPIIISPVAQSSAASASGTDTPLGTLGAIGTALTRRHGFTQSFTEHGYIIGLVSVRADLNYQQGLRKMWSRSTRYDFYFPAFAMLGEQAVLTKELYMTGDNSDDNSVFGYQERWAELRYSPPKITGLFRSTTAGTIDNWHLAQKFTTKPVLNETFITENPPLSRVLAVGAEANGQQLIFDAFVDIKATRPMPLYSVPGLIDHF